MKQTQQAEQEAYDAWKVDQPWYIVSADDKDDPEHGTTHRLMNIAAWTAWEASAKRAALSTTAPAVVAPVAMTEQVAQPLYDLAWKHGARQHVSFAGDELESLSFTPGEFEAFCTELSPAASAEGVTDGQIIEVAARIGSQSLNATRVHELGGDTRTILNESGVVEFARAVLSLAPAASLREQEPYASIQAERAKQDAQWGGPEHDDKHAVEDWCDYIDKQARGVRWVAYPGHPHHYLFRSRLVKIAALAVAAIESNDRNDAQRLGREKDRMPSPKGMSDE